ncbi:hypothetical protein [Sulfurirhabdus autotrophica]|uniref:Uncharacterized protein n=2 Tax=Sulfurirhabdus autotrophica TaxID=1706046 RepID=A0A4R3Y514_9PROT|nr:hypothetical protein [Sulfurirhabdus autotrophica]TCV85898.1 hypothetical protein EDC63_108106 [Sulfurirhabdus autotrophica]
MSGEPIKLTKLQREVLEALKSGKLITHDDHNMPWLGEHALQSQTRYFLTENRLITRQDKTRSIEAKGNGFIISPKGLALINAS